MEKGIYEEINVDALSVELAKEAWKESTREKSENELYEVIMIEDEDTIPQISKQIRGEWSTIFWQLKDKYEALIRSFSKTEQDDNNK